MIFLLLLVTLSPVTASGLDEERQIAADMDNLDCIRLFGDNSNEISSDEGVKVGVNYDWREIFIGLEDFKASVPILGCCIYF